jgi:PIN domain nuclease of toxin-antitoxin system
LKLLLDTHSLLWFVTDDPKLSTAAKSALVDSANERWLSPGTLVEIALKVRIGRLILPLPFGVLFPAQLAADRIHVSSLTVAQIEPLTTLPLHHKDPFDRLIAATALVENTTVVSVDAMFDA